MRQNAPFWREIERDWRHLATFPPHFFFVFLPQFSAFSHLILSLSLPLRAGLE